MAARDHRPRRLFIGLRPPDVVVAAIEQHLGSRREQHRNLRWVRREQWHVTLQFLGACDDARTVASAMAAAAARVSVFSMQFGGFGAFPSPMRATTVWLGLAQGDHRVASLARGLAGPLEKLGFAPERRALAPHMTVARLREPTDARLVLDEVAGSPVGPRFAVTDIVLYESVPDPDGNRYVPLAVAQLAAAQRRRPVTMLDRTSVR